IKTGVAIAGKRRFTIPVHEDELGIGRHNNAHGDFGIKVESVNGVPVVAERSTYFAYKGAWSGGHDVVGATEPCGTWYVAEGCTRDGFETYLCLLNPGGEDATVNVYYYCADGINEERKGVTIPRQSRFTIPVHEGEFGFGRYNNAHGDFSIKVESPDGVPIVVERSMYFSYRPFWTGGHDVLGAAEPSDLWHFAEGCTRDGFETYLCVENPDVKDTTINVYYYCADGKNEERKAINVAAQSRLTLPVHESTFGIGRHNNAHGDFGIRVESTGNVPIVAERSIYFSSPWRTVDKASLAAAWGWGEISRGNTSKRCIALTFDIESSGGLANAILDILKQKGVHSTLFVTGGFPGTYPGVVQRMANEGHEIGNHSVSHAMFTRISAAQVSSELAGTDAAMMQATGYSTKPYFRFPYGDRNGALIRQVNAEGYLSVYWTIDPQEWRSGASVEGVHATVVSQACNGAIVLMHDRAITAAALPGIIDDLRARGYKLVTLTELMYPGP
ncbi:MAG: polysaccharide deacetylase family protein, partial [Actinobacteria bacterium]|nr:polysaccharide deacetylase family protein [Actinomycetota bacterium]